MTKIWRVQNSSGHGPYQSKKYWNDAAVVRAGVSGGSSMQHPTPYEDGINVPGKEWKFGFPTETAAHDWFSYTALDKLSSIGYDLVTLNAEKIVISKSGRQCIWK